MISFLRNFQYTRVYSILVNKWWLCLCCLSIDYTLRRRVFICFPAIHCVLSVCHPTCTQLVPHSTMKWNALNFHRKRWLVGVQLRSGVWVLSRFVAGAVAAALLLLVVRIIFKHQPISLSTLFPMFKYFMCLRDFHLHNPWNNKENIF